MANDPNATIDDLLPGLEQPLWQGIDDEFAAYVQTAFGIPEDVTLVTITTRGSSKRSAVAIGGKSGAIIFALTPLVGRRQTHIMPMVGGRLSQDPAVVNRAKTSSGEENMAALLRLMLRHLPQDVAVDLMAPEYH